MSPPGSKRSDDDVEQMLDEAESVRRRYDALWQVLHEEPVIGLDEQFHVEARVHRLNELGFAVDEVRLETAESGAERVRLSFCVAGRTFHADQLRRLTGLDVGEGQATILMNDLRSHIGRLRREYGYDVAEEIAAQTWRHDVFRPEVAKAHEAVQWVGDATQAYCDLLEVRWLLSEEAGTDVGDEPALAALAHRERAVGVGRHHRLRGRRHQGAAGARVGWRLSGERHT